MALYNRDFAAAGLIGVPNARGRSWPDLDMLPLGWLTDAGTASIPNSDELRLSLALNCRRGFPVSVDRLKHESYKLQRSFLCEGKFVANGF